MFVIIALALFPLAPDSVITLSAEFNRGIMHEGYIYLSPFTGNAIFRLTDSGNLESISFTDNLNYRIYEFQMNPFAVYINTGTAIEKFYLASAAKEVVYTARTISSFIVTLAEDIVLADHTQQELLFLDFTNHIKYRLFDVNARDLAFSGNMVYVLTQGSVLIIDEHANIIEEKKIPERFSNIYVGHEAIYLYSKNKKYFYILNRTWQRVDFPSGISDIFGNDRIVVILDGASNHLSIYNKARIEQQ